MVNPCSPGGTSGQAPERQTFLGEGTVLLLSAPGAPTPIPPSPSCPLPLSSWAWSFDTADASWPLGFVSPVPLPMVGGGQGGGRRTTARLLQPWVLSRLHLDFLAPLEHSRSLSVPSHPPGVTAAGGLAGKGNASLTLRVGRLLVLPCQVERLGRARCYLSQAASQGLSDGGGLHQPHGAWPSEGYYLARMCVLLFPHLFFLLKWCSFAFAWMFHKDRGHLREV